jgi:hypothetical protein
MVRCEALERFSTAPKSIRKLVKKLGPVEKLRACYEAGPTGYVSGYSYNCNASQLRKRSMLLKNSLRQSCFIKYSKSRTL